MIPLFTCKACGFLSTRGDAFRVIKGVRFDKECIARFEAGEEPIATWVREALPHEERFAAARSSSLPLQTEEKEP